ncbi:hypothetical protein [Paludibacterium sp. B53371]|uniref:hypothetical protein n=1 Tax=Paludibacterium sp. B53371 TaxID=2806263 RepID=UPI001C053A6B|nr:hypothetical protein [Paludibacterium sp. B53371]
MHPALDQFVRQFIGTVMATLLPLIVMVFLHMPSHLAATTAGEHLSAPAELSVQTSRPGKAIG